MAMDLYGKSVRIRLLFEESGMLSKPQVDQGLAKSWYLVNADALSIGQLARRIEHDYCLGGSCRQGLVLEMRGFVLPAGQSARILQDSDLVRVRRNQERFSRVLSRELHTNSLSIDNEEIDPAYRVCREGLLAIDEFEKEAGGYQGELSEDGDAAELSLSSGKKMQSALVERNRLRAKESNGKKRKRSVNIETNTQKDLSVPPPKYRVGPEGIDSEPSKSKKQKSSGKKKHDKSARAGRESSQMMALELDVVEELPRSEYNDGGVSAKTEKKKKKKKRQQVEQTELDVNNVDLSPAAEANIQEPMPSIRRKVKSAKATADPEKLAETEERSKHRHDANHDNHESALLKEKSKLLKGSEGNLQTSPEQANNAEKKPSRSARRKKAKKKWLRENGRNLIVPNRDNVKEHQTEQMEAKNQTDSSESETSDSELEAKATNDIVSKKDIVKAQQTESMHQTDKSGSETSEDEDDVEAEAEAEAEEEILPIICAPGHIRFEPVEGAVDAARCAVPVVLSYNEVRCKKQGQAWGQEKTRGRYFDGGHNRRDNLENRAWERMTENSLSVGIVANKTDFENLPPLNRTPSVGDLLAYQLVELTASWTPELSSYRVGKVSMYDGVKKIISLAPVPEYPLHPQQPEEEAGYSNENMFLPPYYPDGTLEVSFDTLMEVRVVEEGPGGFSNAIEVDGLSQKSPAMNATAAEILIKSPQPSTVSEAPVEPTVSIQLNATSRADNTLGTHSEFSAGGDSAGEKLGRSSTAEPEPALVQPVDAGWQDMLSEEINKKILELSSKAGKELEGQNRENAPSPTRKDGAKETSNQSTPVGNGKSNQSLPVENGKTNPRANGAPIIRHRYMRTGALGPTMALLRAKQTL